MNEMRDGLSIMEESQEIEIDFGRIFQKLLRFAWVVALLSLLGAVLMFGYCEFVKAPEYESTASLYIHDKIVTSTAGGSAENGPVGYNTVSGNAAVYLQNTYRRTLLSDTTLSIVIKNLRMPITCAQLRTMIEASVEDYPYFDITVTANDPDLAAQIANELADVLYTQVSQIVGGSSLTHVDKAVAPISKSGPNTALNVILGFAAGFLLSCGVIILIELTNNKINNDEYLISQYGIPVLASITDFTLSSRKVDRYDKKYGTSQYRYEHN